LIDEENRREREEARIERDAKRDRQKS